MTTFQKWLASETRMTELAAVTLQMSMASSDGNGTVICGGFFRGARFEIVFYNGDFRSIAPCCGYPAMLDLWYDDLDAVMGFSTK